MILPLNFLQAYNLYSEPKKREGQRLIFVYQKILFTWVESDGVRFGDSWWRKILKIILTQIIINQQLHHGAWLQQITKITKRSSFNWIKFWIFILLNILLNNDFHFPEKNRDKIWGTKFGDFREKTQYFCSEICLVM